jgi:hypothetical protein
MTVRGKGADAPCWKVHPLDVLSWCWFCGFGLFGPWPDHSTLYTFRHRLGVELFERVLTIAVQACIEAGLVANELIHFDLTAVVARGHRWSPYERAVILSKALIRYLEQVWADQMPEEPFPEVVFTSHQMKG